MLPRAGIIGAGVQNLYAGTVRDLAPVAYWMLDESSGPTAFDSSGNGHHGSIQGEPGRAVPSLSLTGTGTALDAAGIGFVEIGHVPALAPAAGTLSALIKVNAAGDHVLLAKDASGSNEGDLAIRTWADGSIGLYVQNPDAGTLILRTPADTYTAGEVLHVAATWDAGRVTFWLDGAWAGQTFGHVTGLAANTNPWRLGHDVVGTVTADAVIDEVALFDRVLSRAELDLLAEGRRLLDRLEGASDVVAVAGHAELAAALAAAAPGRRIELAPGTYSGAGLGLAASGTRAAPIVVRARDGVGSATLSGLDLTVSGDFCVISELDFSDGRIRLNGRHGRATRCQMSNLRRTAVEINGAWNRVDHCAIHGLDSGVTSATMGVRIMDPANLGRTFNLIDHCHLHDFAEPTAGNNGHEAIQIGSGFDDVPVSTFTSIETCLIEACGAEAEIVSGKTRHVYMYDTTIVDCDGSTRLTLPLRQGRFSAIESCWFENIDGTVRILGTDHAIIGCRLVTGGLGSVDLEVWAGTTTADDIDANGSSNGIYAAAERIRVIGNTIDAAGNLIDGRQLNGTFASAARDNLFEANRDEAGAARPPAVQHAVGTLTSTTTSVPFMPARRLTAAEVGPAAP